MSDTGVGGDAAAIAAAAAAAAAAGNKPWYGDLPPEDAGYMQNRGYDKMQPAAAALAAIKAHREAEKHLGVPANELLRMPKDTADAEGWTRFDTRVGVPAEAKDYDFSTVKVGDQPLDPKLVEKLAPALKSAHVNKADAPAIAKAIATVLAERTAGDADAAAQKLNNERIALKTNWNHNFDANLLIAQGALKTLGATPEEVNALEKTFGYAKVMEMFRNIGARTGEDKFVANNAPGGNGVMSADQAQATLAERKNDQAWVTKLFAGDKDAVREHDNLTRLISSGHRAA